MNIENSTRNIENSSRVRSAQPVKLVWATAICLAAAFHAAGFAYALTKMKAEDIDDALGAPAIEIGLDLTAPHEEQNDLPPGPAAEASAASSASVAQQAKVEPTDLPKAQPTETEDPDRLVAPDAKKTPKDEKPTVTESKANPTADAVASEAAAPPSLEAAREAPRSVAPAQGSGESLQRIRTTWQKELVAHLNRFKRYPQNGAHHAVQIVVSFTLDRLGHVVASSVPQSSGDPAFDHAALAMMALADPVPQPPPVIADEGLSFSLPVIFRDKKK